MRRKRGDIREDGRVFWGYNRRCIDGEWWVAPEKYAQKVQLRREQARRSTLDNRPPAHLRTLKYGDVREDGMVFRGYCRTCQNGEWWVTPKAYARLAEAKRKQEIERHARLSSSCELFKMRRAVRQSARRAAKYASQNKPCRSLDLLGTDLETFKTHIESQFVEGMSWENHGEWHIDHIVPLASGKTPEEIWELCHYTNLQPLWAADNLRKGASLPVA